MVNFFLLLLFFAQGAYGSWDDCSISSSKIDGIESREKPQLSTMALHYINGGVVFSIVNDGKQVGSLHHGIGKNLNKAVNDFSELQDLMKDVCSQNVFGHRSNFVVTSCSEVESKRMLYKTTVDGQCYKENRKYYCVDAENPQNNFPRVELSEKMLENSSDFALVVREAFETNESHTVRMNLLSASISYASIQGRNISLPVGSQPAKDELFDNLLGNVSRGIPLKIEYSDNLKSLKFNKSDFKTYAQLVIGMDKEQTFNLYTFAHAIAFFSHKTGFILPDVNKLLECLRNYNDQEGAAEKSNKQGQDQVDGQGSDEMVRIISVEDEDIQKIYPETEEVVILESSSIKSSKNQSNKRSKVQEKTAKKKGEKDKTSLSLNLSYQGDSEVIDLLLLIEQVETLHGDLLIKGLTSEVILAELFKTFATGEYRDKKGVEAVKQCLADSKEAVEGAVVKETTKKKKVVNEIKNSIPQKRNWLQRLWAHIPLVYAFQYTAYVYLYASLLQKGFSLINAYRS